jgi:uncharacterized protein YcfJ
MAQTSTTETQQEKKKHEIACIAGTVTGVVIGAAVGGIFGNGLGRALMQGIGGSGGAYIGNKLACKHNS